MKQTFKYEAITVSI